MMCLALYKRCSSNSRCSSIRTNCRWSTAPTGRTPGRGARSHASCRRISRGWACRTLLLRPIRTSEAAVYLTGTLGRTGEVTAPVARCARSARYVQAAARASNRRLSTPRGWVTPGPGRDARGSCEPRAAPVVTSGLPLTLGIMPNMGRDWIDEGLRQTPEREQQWQLALERRRRQAATIAAKAPDLMRRLVAEVGAALDEYRKKSLVRADDIEFEPLPHEGFSITKASHPSVSLECRPSYRGAGPLLQPQPKRQGRGRNSRMGLQPALHSRRFGCGRIAPRGPDSFRTRATRRSFSSNRCCSRHQILPCRVARRQVVDARCLWPRSNNVFGEASDGLRLTCHADIAQNNCLFRPGKFWGARPSPTAPEHNQGTPPVPCGPRGPDLSYGWLCSRCRDLLVSSRQR